MVFMSYLLIMFAGILWILRIAATLAESFGKDFPIAVLNMGVEIPLLFATFFFFLFIFKRKIIGALAYMIAYVGYFGTFLYKILSSGEYTPDDYINIFVSVLCVLIPIFIFLDIGLNRNQKNVALHKKTDWFYKNENFDRDFDERADRNQYKF